MKIFSCVQGTTEWLTLRAGIPTASEFDKIVTPGGKASTSAEKYLFALLAERIMGHPRIEAVSTWMNRGSEMEAEAVSFYEMQRDLETVPVGFITNDAGSIGASPDRLVGDCGLLEIKVPAEHTHVGYLLKKSVDQAYYPQIQGQLWIAERQWVDILSYHPEMPPALIRVERDEQFILQLRVAVRDFSLLLEDYAEDLLQRGWIKAWPIPRAVEAESQAGGPEFLSQEDVQYAETLADAAQASPAPPAAPPEPAPKQRLSKNKTNEQIASDKYLFLKAAKVWKGRLLDMDDPEDANRRYYAVLGSLGAEHADEVHGDAARLKALHGWREAHSSGPGPNANKQAGPAPVSQAPASNVPPAQPEALPATQVVAGPPGETEEQIANQILDLKIWIKDYTKVSTADIERYVASHASKPLTRIGIRDFLLLAQKMPQAGLRQAILAGASGR